MAVVSLHYLITNQLVIFDAMMKYLLLMLCLLPVITMGQYHVSGKVIDKDTQQPLAGVSIFLSNASAGTTSGNDGNFTISNVRGGQYEMVISIIGYATSRQTIMVNNNLSLPNVELSLQAIEMKTVRIGIDKHWAEHYAIFKQEFLGRSDFAKDCDILNPHALDFDYDKDKGELTATASVFLEIENRALGYKIKYMLNSFSNSYSTGVLYFEGTAFFEDMQGRPGQVKRWHKNRQQAYLGSSMHFLRSVISNRVAEEGFKVERLIRKPNPAWKGGLNNKYIETLVTTPLNTTDYIRLTDQKGEYAIDFKDCLNIIYNNEPLNSSVVIINTPYIFFDNNGIILNPQYVTMDGVWGGNRVAELLPVDYEPEAK
jgi:hypothetical protein